MKLTSEQKDISREKEEHIIKLLFHQESLVLNGRALIYMKQNQENTQLCFVTSIPIIELIELQLKISKDVDLKNAINRFYLLIIEHSTYNVKHSFSLQHLVTEEQNNQVLGHKANLNKYQYPGLLQFGKCYHWGRLFSLYGVGRLKEKYLTKLGRKVPEI